MTQLICQPLSSYNLAFHTMSHQSSLIVIHFYSYDSFSCAASSFFHGCAIVLTEAACHDSFLTHSWLIFWLILTHIVLHAGRIFQQRHCNCIICLVVESALHVYKGQFSPWFGQFRKFGNSSTLLQALYSLNAQPPGLECLKTFELLIPILCHHCFHHKIPGSIDSWPYTNQVCSLHIWRTLTYQLGCGTEKSVSYDCVTGSARNRTQSTGLVFRIES